MASARVRRLGLLVMLSACGGGASERTHVGATAATSPAPVAATGDAGSAVASCPASIDVPALLALHARAYGTEDAVLAALPRTWQGEIALEGKKGTFVARLGRDRFAQTSRVAGLVIAEGIDAQGAWQLGATGVPLRVGDEEAIGERLDLWLETRRYVRDAADPKRVVASCKVDEHGVVRVTVATDLAELGEPALTFDAATGELTSVVHTACDGKKSELVIAEWSPPDARGVRWPMDEITRPEIGPPAITRTTATAAGLSGCSGDSCFAPPDDAQTLFAFTWKNDAAVHVPAALYLSEVSLRARVKGRELWALLDSGAGLSAVDTTTPLGAAFVPAVELEGAGSTQKIKVGVGAIEGVSLGGLTVPHWPVIGVPIPALDAFGARRPELIVGFSVFLAAVVRVDYAKGEVVLARPGSPAADALHGKSAQAVPVRIWDGKPVAKVTLEGTPATMELDTGDSGGFDLYARWAKAHDLLAARKTTQVHGRFGAGAEETSQTLFRLKRGELGSILVEDRIAKLDDPPATGDVAGLVGNEAFSRCAAVVFDLQRRTLWLEPPCDRKVPEDLAAWRLVKATSGPADRPWVVGAVAPGGSADRAGVAAGDRILAVGGKPAVLDAPSFQSATQKPAGTKVPVEIERDGKRTTLSMELVRLLAP